MRSAPPRTEKAIQLARRMTAMDRSADLRMAGGLVGVVGMKRTAMAQATGTNMFMWVAR